MRRLTALILACTFLCFVMQSQEKHNARFTIRGNIGIIRPISSQKFRTAFAGIYEGNLSANLRLFGDVYMGLGYQSTYFQNTKIFKQQLFTSPTLTTAVPYNTNLVGNGAFLKFGFDRFFADRNRGFVSYSINSGIMFMNYNNVNADTSNANRPYGAIRFSAPYVQPEVAVNFVAEKRLAFSLMLSYTTLFYHFDPKAPRFNQFGDILGDKSNNYVISYFNVAIGFSILLGH